MVRRGSTVRVRQRALTKLPQKRGFLLPDCVEFVEFARVWNRFWNSQAKRAVILLSSLASGRLKVGYDREAARVLYVDARFRTATSRSYMRPV
jgi:hypothetical protein